MPGCLTVAPHLSPGALHSRYRQSRDPVERGRWHLLWLVASGHRVPAFARVTGYSEEWVRVILHRYNATGPEGAGERRHANPGTAPLLDPTQRERLRVALGGPVPDGGLWTSPNGDLDGGAAGAAGGGPAGLGGDARAGLHAAAAPAP